MSDAVEHASVLANILKWTSDSTSERGKVAIRAAIKLLLASDPKSESAEQNYCRRVVFERGQQALSYQADELARERAVIRAVIRAECAAELIDLRKRCEVAQSLAREQVATASENLRLREQVREQGAQLTMEAGDREMLLDGEVDRLKSELADRAYETHGHEAHGLLPPPTRDTFDPQAVRALVAAVRTRLSHGVNTALRPLVKAVEDSERK